MKKRIHLFTLTKKRFWICEKKAQARIMCWLLEWLGLLLEDIVFAFVFCGKSKHKNIPITVIFFKFERNPKTKMQNIGLLRHTNNMSQKPGLGGRRTKNRLGNLTARACSEQSEAQERTTLHLVPLMVPLS